MTEPPDTREANLRLRLAIEESKKIGHTKGRLPELGQEEEHCPFTVSGTCAWSGETGRQSEVLAGFLVESGA